LLIVLPFGGILSELVAAWQWLSTHCSLLEVALQTEKWKVDTIL